MGGAASSLHRLRNLLVIRAYNARPSDVTVAQQFGRIRRCDGASGHDFVVREDVLRVIGSDCAGLLDELLRRCGFRADMIPFDSFVSFLENGSVPGRPSAWKEGGGVYRRVWAVLGFCRTGQDAIVPYECGGRIGEGMSGIGGRDVWMKKETILTEKITTYVTVNGDGKKTELVESDRRLDEVVHVESKNGNEFAHRERTEYEQTETFDGDFVASDGGSEVYVHLKSKDDEYEFLDHSSPSKATNSSSGQ